MANLRPPLPGPDDGLPPGEDDEPRPDAVEALRKLFARPPPWELRDVPQEPFPVFIVAHAPEQRQKLWNDWRAGKEGQQLLQDMAAAEIEYGDALKAAFLAGIVAALGK